MNKKRLGRPPGRTQSRVTPRTSPLKPKGRTKGAKNTLTKDIRRAILEKAWTPEEILSFIQELKEEGDLDDRKWLFEWLYGKAKQQLEMEGGTDITLRIIRKIIDGDPGTNNTTS